MVKKVAKKIVKKGTQLQRVVSEATKGEGKFKEAARTEPLSGTSYSDSPGFGTSNVGKKSVAAEESIVKASMSKTQKAKQTKAAKLETKEEKGTITKKEKKMLDDLNAMSEEADVSRSRKAASTRSSDARKDEGVSLMTEDGPRRVGSKPKLKDSDMLIGNTDNGVTKDGEIIGNPTDNQIQAVVRNMEARKKLSKDAKQNLAKLKKLKAKDKKDRAISIMERNMVDTGPDRTGGIMGRAD